MKGSAPHHGQRHRTGPELMQLMRPAGRQLRHAHRHRRRSSRSISRNGRSRSTRAMAQPVQARAVIIATGARANYLGLPSEDNFKNNGVSACAVCDGALPRFRNKPLVVVGGGDTAVEEATYLTKFASERLSGASPRHACGPARSWQERAWNNPKITIKWNSELDEVLGNDEDGVTGVRLKSTTDEKTEELAVSGVFLAHRPHAEHGVSGRASWSWTTTSYIKWTDAGADLHERRGRLRRGRRGGQLLSPGDHRRGHRLHGGAGRGTLAGGAWGVTCAPSRLPLAAWHVPKRSPERLATSSRSCRIRPLPPLPRRRNIPRPCLAGQHRERESHPHGQERTATAPPGSAALPGQRWPPSRSWLRPRLPPGSGAPLSIRTTPCRSTSSATIGPFSRSVWAAGGRSGPGSGCSPARRPKAIGSPCASPSS